MAAPIITTPSTSSSVTSFTTASAPFLFTTPNGSILSVLNSATPGEVFQGQGSTFLDPNNIGLDIHNFSQSIQPPNSSQNAVTLFPFSSAQFSSDILTGTIQSINTILSPDFGFNIIPGLAEALSQRPPQIQNPDLNTLLSLFL
jgi:hypothetical protein